MGLMMTKVNAQQIDYISSLRINQPYSANLADYANPMSQRMLLTLRYATGDGTVSNVRLKMLLERGNSLVAYSSDVVSGASNINLTVNVTEQIAMDRLAPYFRLENLQGISPETYNRPLPDGIYRVTFEVYEVLTNRKVASASQQMWVTLNEPPVLNTPRNGEMMQFNSSGQNINFQWIPRAIQGGISEYEFTLIELIDNGVSPYQQLLTAIPTFQTTTTATQLSYLVQGGNGGGGIGGLDDSGGGGMGMGFDPPLSPGVKYAWRVKAKAPAGATNVGYYKNDGYSDVFVFKYGGTCIPPAGLVLTPKSYDQISVKWTASQNYSGYKVAYRKYSTDVTWQWVEQATSTNFYTLSGLEANTAYEVKVGGICSSDMISYTDPQTVTTLAAGQTAGVINCGVPPTLNIANQTPIASLAINSLIYANDFPITLTQVTGGNGVFSGEGYVGFPFLNIAKIRVKFTNITVNTDKKLISGFVETAYDPTWNSGVVDVDKLISDIISLINDLQAKLNELAVLIAGGNQTAITAWLNTNQSTLQNYNSALIDAAQKGYGSGFQSVDKDNINKALADLISNGTSTNLSAYLAQLTNLSYQAAANTEASVPIQVVSTTPEIFPNESYAITPVGTPLVLPSGTQILDYFYCEKAIEYELPQGILKGFKINGIDYAARITKDITGNLKFLGYVKYDKYANPTKDDFYKQSTIGAYTKASIVNIVDYERNPLEQKVTSKTVYTAKVTNLDLQALDKSLDKPVNTTIAFNYEGKPTSPAKKALEFACSQSEGTLAQYIQNDKLKKWLESHKKSNAIILFYDCSTKKVLNKVSSGASVKVTDNSTIDNSQYFDANLFSGSTAKYALKVCITKDGKWDVDVKLPSGFLNPNSKLGGVTAAQAEEEIKKTVKRLVENSNKSDGKTPYGVPKETAKDAEGKELGEMYAESGGLVEVVTEVVEAGRSIVNDAKMPEKYWNGQSTDYQNSMIHLPPVIGGSGDALVEQVTEKIQFVKMGLSLVENPGQIRDAWNNGVEGIKNFKFSQIAEGVASQVSYVLTDNSDKAWHTRGNMSVQLASGGILFKLVAGEIGGGMMLEWAKKNFRRRALKARVKSYTNLSNWVDRLDGNVDDALMKRANDLPDAQLGKLDNLYSSGSFTKPASEYIISTNPDGSFLAKTRDGLNNVVYDKNGFPDFEKYSPGKSHFYKSDDLVGNGTTTDFTKANNKLESLFPGKAVASGQKIKIDINGDGNFVEFTWHHHQDGKTMIPVRTDVHSKTAHTGGTAIISRQLQGLFELQ